MFKDIWDSLVRTFVPITVGWIISLFVTAGIVLDPQFEIALTTGITALFGFGYYVVIRLLETYVTPKFGWLLGLAKQPVYANPEKVEELKEIVSETNDTYADLSE